MAEPSDLERVLAAARAAAGRLQWEADNPWATLARETPASAATAWARKRRNEAQAIREAADRIESDTSKGTT
jgi:hypothetical protein